MKSSLPLPDDMPTRYRSWHWVKTLWPYLMEYRGRVLLALLCLVAAKVASVSMPFLLKYQVDHQVKISGQCIL